MDFLETTAVLIPALTGVPVTLYSGDRLVLDQFQRRFCFSSDRQRLYTAAGLEAFLAGGAEELVYDLTEPLGTRLTAFRAGGRWALLGPYVAEGWNGGAARALLAKVGASESAVKPFKAYRCKLPIAQRDRILNAARLVAAQADGSAPREIRTVLAQTGGGAALAYPSDYGDSSVVNRRYAVEDRFIEAVSLGDRVAALQVLKEMAEVIADLRFMSDDFRDYLAGAAILRTLVRMGAKRAGLSPVLIDSISQEYAQKMQHAVSKEEVNSLMGRVTERFCAEVWELRRVNYSPCVRLAMDYMGANLSRQLTVAEIARAAGVDRHRLTKAFGRETGTTVKRYLAQRRCDIAAGLLKDSGASVQDVAAYVGYPDSNYFSKVFKAYAGCSPQDYRNRRWRAGPSH